MSGSFSPEFLSALRLGLVDSFSLSELKTLCTDLGVDYDELGSSGKEAQARELILYLNRRGRLPELLKYCLQLRPDYAWQEPGSAPTEDSHPPAQPALTPHTRILFLAADPADLTQLRLGEEMRQIQERLQLARLRERFDLQVRTSIRPADLTQALLDLQPQVVHFSGHGSSEGLYFEDEQERAFPVSADALGALFARFSAQVQCVLLNACYSQAQAEAIALHIPFVIGMSGAIGDKASIAFSVGFYQALGAGQPIEAAYELGCVQIQLLGIPEHLTPVLLRLSFHI